MKSSKQRISKKDRGKKVGLLRSALRRARALSAWNEGLHPRDNDGKFRSKPNSRIHSRPDVMSSRLPRKGTDGNRVDVPRALIGDKDNRRVKMPGAGVQLNMAPIQENLMDRVGMNESEWDRFVGGKAFLNPNRYNRPLETDPPRTKLDLKAVRQKRREFRVLDGDTAEELKHVIEDPNMGYNRNPGLIDPGLDRNPIRRAGLAEDVTPGKRMQSRHEMGNPDQGRVVEEQRMLILARQMWDKMVEDGADKRPMGPETDILRGLADADPAWSADYVINRPARGLGRGLGKTDIVEFMRMLDMKEGQDGNLVTDDPGLMRDLWIVHEALRGNTLSSDYSPEDQSRFDYAMNMYFDMMVDYGVRVPQNKIVLDEGLMHDPIRPGKMPRDADNYVLNGYLNWLRTGDVLGLGDDSPSWISRKKSDLAQSDNLVVVDISNAEVYSGRDGMVVDLSDLVSFLESMEGEELGLVLYHEQAHQLDIDELMNDLSPVLSGQPGSINSRPVIMGGSDDRILGETSLKGLLDGLALDRDDYEDWPGFTPEALAVKLGAEGETLNHSEFFQAVGDHVKNGVLVLRGDGEGVLVEPEEFPGGIGGLLVGYELFLKDLPDVSMDEIGNMGGDDLRDFTRKLQTDASRPAWEFYGADGISSDLVRVYDPETGDGLLIKPSPFMDMDIAKGDYISEAMSGVPYGALGIPAPQFIRFVGDVGDFYQVDENGIGNTVVLGMADNNLPGSWEVTPGHEVEDYLPRTESITKDLIGMTITDYLLHHLDRHGKNWMLAEREGEEPRILAIDNGLIDGSGEGISGVYYDPSPEFYDSDVTFWEPEDYYDQSFKSRHILGVASETFDEWAFSQSLSDAEKRDAAKAMVEGVVDTLWSQREVIRADMLKRLEGQQWTPEAQEHIDRVLATFDARILILIDKESWFVQSLLGGIPMKDPMGDNV